MENMDISIELKMKYWALNYSFGAILLCYKESYRHNSNTLIKNETLHLINYIGTLK